MAEKSTKEKSTTGAKRGRPKGSTNKNSSKNQNAAKISRREKRINELILAIVLFAVGIFLIISLQTGVAGAIGGAIRSLLMGCFGKAAYILPYYFIVYSALLLFEKAGKTGKLYSTVFLTGFFLLISLFYSITCLKEPDTITFGMDWLSDIYDLGVEGTFGGVIGMSLALCLVKLFGSGGAYVVTLALMAIVILLVANEPFVWIMGKHKVRQREKAIEKERKRNEEWMREQEARQIYERDMEILKELTEANEVIPADFVSEEERESDGRKKKIIDYMKMKETDMFTDRSEFEDVDLEHAPKISKGKKGGEEPEEFLSGKPPQKEDTTTSWDTIPEFLLPKGDRKEEQEGEVDFGPELPEAPDFKGLYTDEVRFAANEEDGNLVERSFQLLNFERKPEPETQSHPESRTKINGQVVSRSEIQDWPEIQSPADVLAPAGPEIEEAPPKPEPSDAGVPPKKEKMDQGDLERQTRQMAEEIHGEGTQAEDGPKAEEIPYEMPSVDLLNSGGGQASGSEREDLLAKSALLEQTLQNFNVSAKVTKVSKGPAVTRYEVQPAVGVKVSSIVRLADDIALNMEAKSIRMEAPIPGKAAVGIEIENNKINAVVLRNVIESQAFQESESKITFAVGEDISGNPVVANLKDMPHLLIAGSTGSGKSVCINSIIISLLYKAKPDEVKIILVDPKVVELSNYNGIPHLMIPVVNEPSKAAVALNWAVAEMNDRYQKFAKKSVKDLASYNRKMENEGGEKLPQIVIIIDELADLMMAAPQQVEDAICRLAQMARAAGMHLIVATQRPSVDVITGVIKANIPSRIAFAVSSQIDSRTILDMAGAERLVGKGDMLFNPLGKAKPLRVQGTLVTDEEVERVIDFVKNQGHVQEFSNDLMDTLEHSKMNLQDEDEVDELLRDAIEVVVNAEQASVSMLQRKFRIGYNRAARLVDMMEERGIVGPADGSRPRRVLLSKQGLAELDGAMASEGDAEENNGSGSWRESQPGQSGQSGFREESESIYREDAQSGDGERFEPESSSDESENRYE